MQIHVIIPFQNKTLLANWQEFHASEVRGAVWISTSFSCWKCLVIRWASAQLSGSSIILAEMVTANYSITPALLHTADDYLALFLDDVQKSV